MVVPANAGTHNDKTWDQRTWDQRTWDHRTWGLRESRRTSFLKQATRRIRPGVRRDDSALRGLGRQSL